MNTIKQKLPLLLNDLYLLARSEEKLEEKLKLYQFVAACFHNNYSNTYVHKQFEQDLTTISCELIKEALPEYKENNHTLHVLTDVYHVGGHTRVVDNWIKSTPAQQHSIIINHSISTIPDFLKDTVRNSKGQIIINNETNLIGKARCLARVSNQYHHVILHIFPHDILPLVAFGTPHYTRPTFFFNHADHVWGCGYSVCDAVLEISTHGEKYSNLYRGISREKTKFVGIPIEMNIGIDEKNIGKEKRHSKTIVSMATYYKFEPFKNLSFQDFVDRILTRNNQINFCIIGVEKHQASWQWLLKKYQKNVSLLGTLEKSEAHKIIKRAHLYLDSFPLGSSTSMIEAISLRVPALSHKSITKNMDSYKALSFSSLDELTNKIFEIFNYTEEEKEKFVTHALNTAKHWHDLNNFKDRIETITQSYTKHDPLTLADNIMRDDYIEKYSDFMYQLLQDDAFRFDYALFINLSHKTHEKICRLLEQHGLLYTSKQMWGDTTILEAMDGIKYFSQLFISLRSDPGFRESCSKVQHFKCDDNIVFDLSEYKDIQELRFDPINYPAKIKEIYAQVELRNGHIQTLELKWHNGIVLNNVIDFHHSDPQIIFDIPSIFRNSIKLVKLQANIQPYSKAELLSLQHTVCVQYTPQSTFSQKIKKLLRSIRENIK